MRSTKAAREPPVPSLRERSACGFLEGQIQGAEWLAYCVFYNNQRQIANNSGRVMQKFLESLCGGITAVGVNMAITDCLITLSKLHWWR